MKKKNLIGRFIGSIFLIIVLYKVHSFIRTLGENHPAQTTEQMQSVFVGSVLLSILVVPVVVFTFIFTLSVAIDVFLPKGKSIWED